MTTPRFLPGPTAWYRFWLRAEGVPPGHFVRSTAAAHALLGHAEPLDSWQLAPPERAPDPHRRLRGAGWRRARLPFAVFVRTLRARAQRLRFRTGAALAGRRGAAPYLALAAALLAGSVLGSLYASSVKDTAPQASLPSDQPGTGSGPDPSLEVAGISAVALVALEPDRIAGTVRAALPGAGATLGLEPATRAAPVPVAAPSKDEASLPQEQSPPPAAAPLTRDDLHKVLYQLGYALQLQGAADQAVAMYRRAAELDPGHAATLYNWGYILQQRGEPEAAMAKYREAIQVDPEHFYAGYNLGWLLQKQGDFDAAIDQYQRAAALDSTNPYVFYNWGYILERRGEIAEALRLYARALEIAPDRRPGTDAQERIAALHFGRGQRLAAH